MDRGPRAGGGSCRAGEVGKGRARAHDATKKMIDLFITLPGGALRDFKFYYENTSCLLFLALYGIWRDVAAGKILLQDVALICLQF